MANKSMYYSLKIGAIVAKYIPRKIGLQVSYALGVFFGSMPTKSRKKIMSVQRRIAPELSTKSIKKRAAQVKGNYAQYWWDVFWMSSPRSLKQIGPIVRIEGNSFFEEVKKIRDDSNIGVIIALPHIGSWEIPGSYFSKIGFPPLVVAERLKPPELFELFTRTRTQAGMTVIAHDDSPSVKLLDALREKKMICLVSDRDIARRGIEVNFFGAKKSMPAGPASLAIKSGAPIIPACMYLTHNGDIEASFSRPILAANFEIADKADKIAAITQKLAEEFESMIAKAPTQWHVLKDEWKKDA